MRKYIIKTTMLYLIPFIFFLPSCSKFLDEKPDHNLTVPKLLNDLQGLFNDAERMNFGLTPSFGESSSDDYFLPDATYNFFGTSGQNMYIWSLRDYVFQNDWSANYFPVYNANFALESLEKIDRTIENAQQWDQIKGNALFWRAYCFLNLSWQFANAYDSATASRDLGIALRTVSDFNVPSFRATVQECYDKILQDAKASLNYLPNSNNNIFLPTKAASNGLIARCYLSMRIYDSAYKYAALCLSEKSELLDYNKLSPGSYAPFSRTDNPEIIFYTEVNTYQNIAIPSFANIDSTLYKSYDENDLRKVLFFTPIDNDFMYKGAYSGFGDNMFSGIATDEMLLVRAETHARTGNVTEAMNDLNSLLEKRWNNSQPYVPVSATDPEDAIRIIVNERRKELVMRGLRWIDIKRLNKEGANITPKRLIGGQEYILPPNDKRYALPLPSDVIKQSGMPQNP